jgi:hypothetical protein
VTTWARTAYTRAADGVAEPGDPAVRRVTALVVVVLCLLAVSDVGYGASDGGLGEALTAMAMVALPLLYVVPATRPWWLRHRYPLLAVQAVLTCVPFALFGGNWVPGPSGWLAGLVLLTVPSPASWLVSAMLAAAEEGVRAGVVGLPASVPSAAPAAAAWTVIFFAVHALVLFGLARLADLVVAVHAARDEFAETAVTAERLRAADSLRAAIGDRLVAAAGRAAAALQAIAGNRSQAREHITETARRTSTTCRTATSAPRSSAGP